MIIGKKKKDLCELLCIDINIGDKDAIIYAEKLSKFNREHNNDVMANAIEKALEEFKKEIRMVSNENIYEASYRKVRNEKQQEVDFSGIPDYFSPTEFNIARKNMNGVEIILKKLEEVMRRIKKYIDNEEYKSKTEATHLLGEIQMHYDIISHHKEEYIKYCKKLARIKENDESLSGQVKIKVPKGSKFKGKKFDLHRNKTMKVVIGASLALIILVPVAVNTMINKSNKNIETSQTPSYSYSSFDSNDYVQTSSEENESIVYEIEYGDFSKDIIAEKLGVSVDECKFLGSLANPIQGETIDIILPKEAADSYNYSHKINNYELFKLYLEPGHNIEEIVYEAFEQAPWAFEGRTISEIINMICKDNGQDVHNYQPGEYIINLHATEEQKDNLVQQGLYKQNNNIVRM